jgi:hypothetical protein
MKIFFIVFGLLSFAQAMTLEQELPPNRLLADRELEEIKAERESEIKTQKNEPNKITYKSNINDDAYKARKSCLMSEKTAEECNKLFPVVKKTFTTSYEFKNVEPEVKKEIEKSEKLKSLIDEESSSLNSDPIHVDA